MTDKRTDWEWDALLWEWDALPDDVLGTMKLLGDFGPTVNVGYREIKGYMDGETYFDSSELRTMAKHFIVVADWLDKRADSK